MKNITLVRHGQSLGNVNANTYSTTPDWKIPLTNVGIEQAEIAGKYIARLNHSSSIDVYYSPMIRAAETYKIIRPYIASNISLCKEEPLISEQSFGMPHSYRHDFRNRDMMIARKKYGSFYFTPPDGESGLDVTMRVKQFIQELKVSSPDNNVLLITHGSFIKLFLKEILGWNIAEYESYIRPDNGKVIRLDNDNDNGHLQLITPLKKYD